MAHVMKYTKASCGHMFAHFDRKAENITNENLNRERTYLNYNLAEHQQRMGQGEFLRKRCSEIRCHNRKDVNVMASWVITAPEGLIGDENEMFFELSYNFLNSRYGKENVVSAYVHMDEITPHMHYAFVPVVKDKKRDGFKLSAKEVITRKDLQTFHVNLSNYLQSFFGRDVGVLNEATIEGNKSIEELKRQSAVERLQEINEKASVVISKAQIQAQKVEDSLTGLKAEYEGKKAYIRQSDDMLEESMMYPSYAKLKKDFFGKETVTVPKDKWEQRYISEHEKECIKFATTEFEKAISKFQKTSSAEYLTQLERKVDNLDGQVRELNRENLLLKKENMSAIKRVNEVLRKLPDEVSDKFRNQWNEEKSKSSRYEDDEIEF